MRKIGTLFAFLGFAVAVNAQSYDYSTGNTNPYARYNYITPQQQALLMSKVENETIASNQAVGNYFSNQISNPKNLSSGAMLGKYQHLQKNSNYLQGCWDSAGAAYKVDPWLLMAIAKVESNFNNHATNINTNKSVDIGMMQINTIWLPTLSKFGISKNDLLNPCTSVFVGAWILAQNIRYFGYNADGIGAYNSPKNVSIRRKYAGKVYLAYNELVRDLYYNKK